jgi:site-specific DNA recombinase
MRLLQAARLSRLGDASTGIDKQDLAATQYANAFGHEIIGTAVDTDVSGNTRPFDRPKLGPWLKRPDEFDGIIAAHLDRLGRNVRQLAELHQWAEDNNKVLITVEPNIDWSSEVGKLLWSIMSWLAEQELKAITRRSIDTQNWLKANGYLVGRPPFGFQVVTKDDHKTLEPIPELRPIIREMVERALNGDTLTSTCEWLDDKGIAPPAGGLWSPKSVSQILRNTALIGRRTTEKGRTVLRFESIIDTATFDKLQAKLDSNPRRRGAVSSDPAMLTGVIYCNKCKGVMHRRRSATKRKDGSRYVYEAYRCDGTPRQPSTCKNMIPLADMDARVHEWFTTGPIAGNQRVETFTVAGHGYDEELEQNARDIADLDIDAPNYDVRLAELRAERKRLQSLPHEDARIELRLTGVLVRDHWASLSTAERRAYLVDSGFRVYADRDTFDPGAAVESALWWRDGDTVPAYDPATLAMERWRPFPLMDPNELEPGTYNEWPDDAPR